MIKRNRIWKADKEQIKCFSTFRIYISFLLYIFLYFSMTLLKNDKGEEA